jgi:hypothetical protein
MTATFTATLPARKSSKNGTAVRFTAGANPGTGLLLLGAGRTATEYLVVEFAADGGRGFRLAKVTEGTDAEADGYDVFACGTSAPKCHCRGALRWNACKHSDAVAELLASGQL